MKDFNFSLEDESNLDLQVARIEGFPLRLDPMGFKTGTEAGWWIWPEWNKGDYMKVGREYSPASKWSQAAPLIEKYKVSLVFIGNEWVATVKNHSSKNKNPLVAAMKAIISSEAD